MSPLFCTKSDRVLSFVSGCLRGFKSRGQQLRRWAHFQPSQTLADCAKNEDGWRKSESPTLHWRRCERRQISRKWLKKKRKYRLKFGCFKFCMMKMKWKSSKGYINFWFGTRKLSVNFDFHFDFKFWFRSRFRFQFRSKPGFDFNFDFSFRFRSRFRFQFCSKPGFDFNFDFSF